MPGAPGRRPGRFAARQRRSRGRSSPPTRRRRSATSPWTRTFVSADDSLDDVLGVLADGHQSWVPVVANDRLAGILSTRDVVAAYRGALAANVRQVNTVGSTGSLLEAEIGPGSVLAGKPVSETAWPRDSVLVSVMRGEKVIVPRGNVVLEAGDHLTVFTRADGARDALQSLLASRIAQERRRHEHRGSGRRDRRPREALRQSRGRARDRPEGRARRSLRLSRSQRVGQEHDDPLPARPAAPTAGRIGAFGLDATRDGVAMRRRLTYVPGELGCPTG